MHILIVVSVIILALASAPANAQELWVAKDGSIRNVDAKAMIIGKGAIYLATGNEVYMAKDAGDKWGSIFSIPSGENEITSLAGKQDCIFVGTRRGLFKSRDRGRTWQNVFRTVLPEKNNILAIEVSRQDANRIVIGTAKGVFLSTDSGDRWQDISGSLKNKPAAAVALNKDSIYASCEAGLYVLMSGRNGWDRIYVKSSVEKSGEEDAAKLAEGYEYEVEPIGCVAFKGSRLYLGLGKKIVYSDTGGKEWIAFSSDGLNGEMLYILVSQKSDKMYCATSKGVFEFAKDRSRWIELYRGMDKAVSVSKLIFGGEDEASLWALADRGIYKLESGRYMQDQFVDVEKNLKGMKMVFDGDPPFRQLQQAALKFAELGPDKIANWRNQARLKALMPKVSLGFDKGRSTNAEIYTSATKDYIVAGPDDVTSGLDLSVSWELADLIWSDDQTNIDVRSRLTTQLRNDVLDDLRRAYYERRRILWELMMEAPDNSKARFEKELRLQELTQAIDDLTGNYLSDYMKDRKA